MKQVNGERQFAQPGQSSDPELRALAVHQKCRLHQHQRREQQVCVPHQFKRGRSRRVRSGSERVVQLNIDKGQDQPTAP
ncbi:hypothetical protein D1872_214110 [compost metagenome]